MDAESFWFGPSGPTVALNTYESLISDPRGDELGRSQQLSYAPGGSAEGLKQIFVAYRPPLDDSVRYGACIPITH